MNFEASGGLKNSSLIMQDQETDTYWSIMEGEAVAGELAGSKLIELPVRERISWRHWRAKHPTHSCFPSTVKSTVRMATSNISKTPKAF